MAVAVLAVLPRVAECPSNLEQIRDIDNRIAVKIPDILSCRSKV